MKKGNKFKLLAFLSLLIGCAGGAKTLIVDASIKGPNGKDAPEVQYNDVATYDVNYYSSIVGKKGTSLLNGLATLSQQNHRYFNTYDELWGGNCYSDADKNDPNNKLIDFYTQLSISNEYCTNNMSGYNANINWNREHVWCQSLSGGLYGKTGAGADIHHLRPNVANINSSRNNSPYGEVGDEFAVFYNETDGVHATSSTGTLYGYLNNNVFEPIDNVKGDVARIIMYLYMHYSNKVSPNSSYDKAGSLEIPSIVSVSSGSEWDLLRSWNELDPVDEFESNRNNYCASVTGLRNPFIDHPEFADIIWDTSYSGDGAINDNGGSETPTYYLNLTSTSTSLQVGQTHQIQVNTNIPTLSYTSSNQAVASVSQSGLITALSSWTISITNDGSATIKTIGEQSSNLLRYNSGSSLFSCYSSGQQDICLYKFVEQTSEEIKPELKFDIVTEAEMGFKASSTTTTTTIETSAKFEKVTSTPSDWSGQYLIVYEDESFIFDGSLTTLDAVNNYSTVTINNETITTTTELESNVFTISSVDGGYTIKSSSGYYIGQTSNANGLQSNNITTYTNTLSLNSDKTVNIISSGTYLRFNTTSGQDRFRYYKSSSYTNQKAICLYKKVGGEETKTETTWEFSDYQLRFSSKFTSDLVLDETYPMESLTFGYIITPKKFLDNNGYVSFEDAYESNDNDLNKVKTLLKAKTDTLNVTNTNNNYTFGFILRGITNVNAEYSVSFYVKTKEGDIYFSATKSTSISTMVDKYLADDSVLNNYDNKAQILLALNAMKEQFA